MRTKYIDNLLRESFGFMYSPWGRCLFLSMYVTSQSRFWHHFRVSLFFFLIPTNPRISIFPFGMVGVYGVLVSFSGFLNAYFNYYVITKVGFLFFGLDQCLAKTNFPRQHPSFTRGIPDYEPPEETPANSGSVPAADNNVV